MKLDKVIADINSKFGEGTVVLGNEAEWLNIEKVSTGSFSLDLELRGGIPRSRITEIFGLLGCGKSSLSLLIAKQVQKLGENVAWIDVEGSYDSVYAGKIGINKDRLLISQPEFGEKVVDVVDAIIRSNKFGLVVVDSIAAISPMVELEESAQKQQMGVHAKLINKMIRRIQSGLNTRISNQKNKTSVVLINQLRSKIGMIFGSPYFTPGGMGIGFGACLRLHLKRGDWLCSGKGEKEQTVGQEIKVNVEKSKVSPVNATTKFKYYFRGVPEEGINAGTVDYFDELLRYGTIYDLIKQKKDGQITFKDKEYASVDEFRAYLMADKEERKWLRRMIADIVIKGYDTPIVEVKE